MRRYQKFYLSLQGKRKYQKEKAELEQALAGLSEDIKLMRHYNEIKANAAWEEAQRQLNFLSLRLEEVDSILAHANLVRRKRQSRRVKLGSTVKVRSGRRQFRYKIVDPVEANPAEGRISFASPVGTALVGRHLNEEIQIDLPTGQRRFYQVLAIT